MGEYSTAEAVHALDPTMFETSLVAIRSSNFQITHDDSAVDIHGKLGGGGTKTAYDASVGGESFALALPNTTDSTSIALAKWQVALNEPKATDAMREMGFIVNPVCEVMPVNIDDTPFPAIKMARYQDMPIQIRDGKNHSSSVIKNDLFPDSLSLDSFMDGTGEIRTDIAALIRKGVGIGRDSFNVCIANGQMRLYFNDLATAKFEPISPEDAKDYAEYYSRLAVGTIMNGMSHGEFQRQQKFFDEEFGYQGRGYDAFTDLVMAELTQAA